ncbi:MAG: PAS domain S-box protein [Verrucomicrobia bacterium]|nr:PAS domain S-box protein [Verrucomicrobiota bacterium]
MADERIKILLIEDVPKFARMLREMLQSAHDVQFALEWVESLSDGLEQLKRPGIELVLLDLSLSDCRGLESFGRARSLAPHVPIIVLSSLDDETVAVRAVHEGAQDYLVKGQIDSHLLVRSIRYAIERKKAETALLQAEEKYRSIFEHIVEGIFQTTPDGHYLSANPALARIYGYETPEELASHLTDIQNQLYVDPNRRADFIRLMEQYDVVKDFTSQIYRKDRSIIWISEYVRAVRDANHNLLYYEGTVEDITERKRAEERLQNSEALYHSLVESLPQNIFRKDLNERFTFTNRRFCQTLGKPLEEILGKTDFDFFPPELAAKYQQDDRRILESGELFETVEEHQPPGGEKLYVNVVKTPIYDSNGRIIGLQGIFWDITEKRRAEERLRKTSEELAKHREELRIKNQQMEEDLRMAREIQQSIIPQQYPTFPRSASPKDSALRFCHRYFPTGTVGGDFFNVLALSDTRAGVFICDVMGHGVRSALVTAIIRALVEEMTPVAADPGQLLRQLNRDLRAILKQSGTPLFTTAFYLVADLEAGQICYANAGHPKQLLLRRSSREVELLQNPRGKSSPALGLFDHPSFPTSTTAFAPNDLVMLFTDGLYDVIGPAEEKFHFDWLVEEVRKRADVPAALLFDELIAQIRSASEGGEFADDVCLVGMEMAPRMS